MTAMEQNAMGTDCGHWYDDYGPDGELEEDDDPLQEWVMDCGDPNCCMNFAPHYRQECYTPEMYEAHVAEMEEEQADSASDGQK